MRPTTRDAATEIVAAMKTWIAHKHIAADPAVVLDLLTDTESCREWSPVPFDVDGAAGARLAAGPRMRIACCAAA